jgi:hypothetical protein
MFQNPSIAKFHRHVKSQKAFQPAEQRAAQSTRPPGESGTVLPPVAGDEWFTIRREGHRILIFEVK